MNPRHNPRMPLPPGMSPDGFDLPLPDAWFPVIITAVSGGEYEFEELALDGDENWDTKPGGRLGDSTNPGIALFGTFAVNDYALARSAPNAGGTLWELMPLGVAGPAGGGVVVEEVDGAPSVSASTVKLDQDTGLKLTDNGGGTCTVQIKNATASQWGAVTDASQTFGGLKTFDDGAISDELFDATDGGTHAALHAAGYSSYDPPDTLASAPAGTTTTPPTTTGESSLVFTGGAGAFGYVTVTDPLDGTHGSDVWVVPGWIGASEYSGRLVVAGRYALWDASDGKVYTGVSGTNTLGDVFKGGVLTTIGSSISFPLSLANGGTGANLSDPNADRILFWDDSAGGVTWLAVTNVAKGGLAISGTNISVSYTSESYMTINGTTTRSFDADSTTLNELADVLATLIFDLQARNII